MVEVLATNKQKVIKENEALKYQNMVEAFLDLQNLMEFKIYKKSPYHSTSFVLNEVEFKSKIGGIIS